MSSGTIRIGSFKMSWEKMRMNGTDFIQAFLYSPNGKRIEWNSGGSMWPDMYDPYIVACVMARDLQDMGVENTMIRGE